MTDKKTYMVSNHPVGSTAYYEQAIQTGFYGVEDDGPAFKTEKGDSPEEKAVERDLMERADEAIFPAWDR